MFHSVSGKFPFFNSGRIPLSTRISGRNSALSVMDVPPVVPPVVSVPISTSHNPVLIPTSSTMNAPLRMDTEGQSLYSRIRSHLLDKEVGSTSGSGSGSQLLALKSLPETEILDEMQLIYRFFPDHTFFSACTFTVTKRLKKRLKQICKSIGFFSSTIPYYVPDVFEYSNLGQGLRSLVNEKYDKIVVESLTFYKGKYGKVIILVSLGVSCTIWSMYVPGVVDIAPPVEVLPRFESYQSFFNPNTDKELFSKACYIQQTDISSEVIKTFEKEFPFTEMNIPATGDKRIAVGLALMIVVFMGLGVVPVKEIMA